MIPSASPPIAVLPTVVALVDASLVYAERQCALLKGLDTTSTHTAKHLRAHLVQFVEDLSALHEVYEKHVTTWPNGSIHPDETYELARLRNIMMRLQAVAMRSGINSSVTGSPSAGEQTNHRAQ